MPQSDPNKKFADESSKKAEKLLSEKGFNVDCHLQENLGHGIDINGLNVAKEFIKKIFKV